MKKLIFSVLLLLMTVIGAMAQTTAPYNEGFEDMSDAGDLTAAGWISYQSDAGSFLAIETSASNVQTGSKALNIDSWDAGSNSDYVVVGLPVITNKAINELQITFSYKVSTGNVSVGYLTDVDDASTFVSLADFNASSSYTTKTVELNNAPNTAARIAIKYLNWYRCYVDDIEVKAVPTCRTPMALTASGFTDNSATLSWTQTGDATNWVLEYSTNSDFSSASMKSVSGTSSYTLTNLNPTTTYYVRVKADCGGGDESEWSNEISFSTTAVAEVVGDSWSDDFEGATCEWELINGTLTNAWAWGTAVNNGGTHALYISNDNGGTNAYSNGNTMVYAQKLLNFATGKYEFSYDWNANGESNYDYLRVALVPASVTLTAGTSLPNGLSSNAVPTGWIALDGGSKLNLVDTWQTAVNAVNVTAGNYYLVFAWRNDSGGGTQPPAAIDNVSITRIACAYDVTGLAVSNITTTAANLTWTAGEASQWQVAYSTSSDFAGATEQIVNTASFNMTSLTSASTYYVKVRAYCGGTDFGAWSSVLEFNTACDAITSFPWSEDFELINASGSGVTLGVPCWVNEHISGTGTYFFEVYSGTNGTNSTNQLRLRDMYSGTMTKLMLPVMNFGGVAHQFVLDVYRNAAGTSYTTEGIRIYASADGEIEGATELGFISRNYATQDEAHGIPAESASGWYTYEFNIPLTGICYIIIRGESLYGSSTYMDNFIVREAPSCIKPTALSKSNVTARTVDLSWTAGGSETAWQICLNDNEGNPIDVNTNSYTLIGLTPETAYNVKVRAKCSESDYSEWTSDISFTTTVACPVPTALAYADVTTNSVVLSWTAGASETAWQICINNEEDDLIDVTENPYTLTGLDPATSYSVKVRANCGDTDGNSQWTSAVLFSTSCLAITELPYTESFESETCPASCWNIEYAVANPASSNVMKHVTSTDYSPYGCGAAANDGDRSFLFSSYSNTSDYNQYLISPEFDVDGSYLVSFYYRQRSTDEHLYFGTSSTGNDVSDFTWTDEEIPAYSGTWKLYRTIVPAGTKYFAINYNPGACLYYAWIDNVVVREVSTAAEILTYSLPTQASEATITSGDNTGTIDITVTYSTNFDADLNPTYTISDYAEISAPEITGDGDSRTIRYTVTAEAGNSKVWTVNVTRVSVSHDAFITGFTFAGQKAGTTAEIVSNTETNTYTVNAVADWNVDLTSIAPVITVSPAAEITPGSATTQDFSSMVAYTVTAEDGTTSHVYNVTIINDPDACVNPTDLEANGLTSHTATLNWLQAYTETAYIVKVSATELTDEELETATELVFNETVAALTANVEGLDANTQYFVYIQSDCENADGWAEYSFRTKCDAFNVPFVETFGNDSDSRPCWTIINANDDNKTWIYENGSVKYTYHSSNAANDWLISPKIAVVEGAYLTFEYKSSTSWPEKFSVYVMDAPENYATSTVILPTQTVSVGSFTPINNIDLAAYAGQDIYIGIKCESDADQLSLYIDNFKVKFPPFTITASADPNGSIDPNGNVEVEYGESQSFTITPNDCYHIASVLVDGVEAISNVDENGVYTFDNVTAAHTIAATFALNTYNITTSVVGNGTITESCVANCGENKSFAIQPQGNCYRIASFTVDGVDAINDLDENGVYAMQNITADHTLVATFEQKTFTITATAEGNGTITETSTVNCGENKEITITPANCYSIASVLVDDVDVTATVVAASGVYTFENVMANHTIAATFEQITYTFTVNAGANGSITANDGNGNVANCGENKMFTIAANDCYHIASVTVDDNIDVTDAVIAANGVYTFENVTAAHTIAATFAINTYNITTTVEGNGTISGESTANCGDNKSFVVAPANACYRIASFTVDGVDAINGLDGNGVYALQNITADHTLAATFEQITYTITATAEGNGTITETSTVNCGENKEITIAPANCYSIASVLVDDVDVTATVVAANGVYTFENVMANHTIAATFEQITYTITANADANGSITANDGNGNVANCGENKSFTIAANDCYHVVSVTVDGVESINDVDENGVYTFENVTANHTIAAIFAINTYYISASAEGNGTITESCTANCGENKSFVIAPASNCYRIASVLVDGVDAINDLDENGVYAFQNITADHTIAATFEQITYTITATAGENGTITETSTVNCGDNKEITITPANCYRIASVLVDDVDVTPTVLAANGVYTFENVIANHTIAATFAISTYNITATAGEGGSITANDGNGNVANCGENKAFTITANEGYRIASVIVDETENVTEAVIAAEGVYTFENVTADHTIAATFERVHTISAGTGAGGSITPEGFISVLDGESQTFTITPVNECFRIGQVMVDGVDVTDEVIANNGVYTFENVTENHNIVANFDAITLTITATASEGGTITHNADYEVIPCASNESYTIVANDGYRIVSVIVDDEIDVTNEVIANNGVYTFTNVRANHTIAATFELIPANSYTITATAGDGGTITPNGEVTVYEGDNKSFTIVANGGYRISSVMVDNETEVVAQLVDGVYTFTNLTANHTIAATFEIIPTYTLTIHYVYADNTPAAEDHVETLVEGAEYSVASPVVTGYTADQLVVEGTMPANDVVVNVTYTINTYTITATAGENGTITPNGELVVNYGATQAFTIVANDGYRIASIMVDETEDVTAQLVDGVYTFENVIANHTIAATFESIPTYTLTIHYVYADNTPAADDYVETLVEGAEYSVASPVVTGHTADQLVVEGTMPAEDVVVNVIYTINTYTITATAGENGTITPSGDVVVNYGATQTFSISANDGYRIMSVLVDGAEAISELVDGVYTFANISANHTIAAAFVSEAATTYTITATADENGIITPSGVIEVVEGESRSFTIEAAAGYHIVSVMVDETENVTEQLVNGVYTFDNVTADHTIAASFAINTYTITATAGDNGTITPAEAIVNYGASQEFTILANEGYRIASVMVDETEDVTEEVVDGVYTFTNVTANHTIAATFEAIPVPTYTITLTVGEHGSVTPSGENGIVTVNEGDDITFTVTPDEGYLIGGLIVDETPVYCDVEGDVVNFYDVHANHTIEVVFTEIPATTYTITATAGANGTINPEGEVTVTEGENKEFTIVANEGYRIASVIVDADTEDEEDVTDSLENGVYTFENVTANHTIYATFEDATVPNTHTVTLTVGDHGTVTASDEDDNEIAIVDGAITVNHGDDLYLEITPDENYKIETLAVNGVEYELDEEEELGLTLPMLEITEDMAVSVTFTSVIAAEMFEAGSMTVYPNPNNGMFSIDFSNIEGDATYQIINANGAVVETRDINVMNGETMNFSHDLRPGAYFVRIINGEKVYVEQIVVE